MKRIILAIFLCLSYTVFSLPFDTAKFICEYQIATTIDGPLFFSKSRMQEDLNTDFPIEHLSIKIISETQYKLRIKEFSPDTNNFNETELIDSYSTDYSQEKHEKIFESNNDYSFEIIFNSFKQKYLISISSDGIMNYTTSVEYPTNRGNITKDDIILIIAGRVDYTE